MCVCVCVCVCVWKLYLKCVCWNCTWKLTKIEKNFKVKSDIDVGVNIDDRSELKRYWGEVFACEYFKFENDGMEIEDKAEKSNDENKLKKVDKQNPIYQRVKKIYDTNFDTTNEACHSKCPICEKTTKPNAGFTEWTCEQNHILAGCSLTLEPIWKTPGRHCVFCGRDRFFFFSSFLFFQIFKFFVDAPICKKNSS